MTKTLLAVEDSKTMQRVLDITFAGDEYRAVIDGDPAAALSHLDSVQPDMVLLDVTLGDSNGYDLCQQIKARAPGVPVMILSSRQQPYDAARGAAVQADDHIDKPFDTQQLRDKVDKLCQGSRAGMGRVVLPQTPVPPAPPIQSAVASAPPPIRPAMPPRVVASRPPPAPGASAVGQQAVASLADQLQGLNLTQSQVEAVLALSREVVEKAVWEVVPTLAEKLIKEEIARLTSE